MIASVRGQLIYTDNNCTVVECGGVGYKCFVTKNTLYNLPPKGDEVMLYTFLSVREDAMDLYGFKEIEELEAFKLVTSVNGVGAKMGLALLSEFTASQLTLYIASGDHKALTAASGVGPKLAQRIVLELRDKVGSLQSGDTIELKAVGNATANSNTKEAVTALVTLGYTQSEASLAVGKCDPTLSTEEIIKQALKTLARGI
ncbi:MAG: Holliday junction branch migration protein RuvA [Ruminococcaceae bacterium]|nr:Holliday junction branch migration protein RuvA [Oscillospiraceae bacterium]